MKDMKKKKIIAISILVLSIGLILTSMIAISSSTRSGGNSGNSTNTSTKKSHTDRTSAYINTDAELSMIEREEGVVNVYMFWGNGCPHCKAQWETLEELKKEYPDFNAYGFEVWYNETNRDLMSQFAAAISDDSPEAVPYMIIGKKSYVGAQSKEKIIEALDENKDGDFDVYFDKIKK